MSKLLTPTNAKPFLSILYREDLVSDVEVKSIASSYLGDYDELYPSFNPLTDYYTKEMGEGLKRAIFVSKSAQDRSKLVEFKLRATDDEIKMSRNEARTINIDVGILAKEQVLLATGKPYSHRIYLYDGVYAELVYVYKDKAFHSQPWTYPDYDHQEKRDFFNSLR